MKFTINFKADTPTKNNHVYPKSVLKKAFDSIAENKIFVTSKAPTSFASVDIRDIIGEVKEYEITKSGDIIIDVDVFKEDLFNNKEITTYGVGSLDKDNIIKDDFKLCGFFVCEE